MIGPAVDCAAGHMNDAEGAFVWLTPDAAQLHGAYWHETKTRLSRDPPTDLPSRTVEAIACAFGESVLDRIMTRLPKTLQALGATTERVFADGIPSDLLVDDVLIPFKVKEVVFTARRAALNPHSGWKHPSRDSLEAVYLRAMTGERCDIRRKGEHTLAFLKEAEAVTKTYEEAAVRAFIASAQKIGGVDQELRIDLKRYAVTPP